MSTTKKLQPVGTPCTALTAVTTTDDLAPNGMPGAGGVRMVPLVMEMKAMP